MQHGAFLQMGFRTRGFYAYVHISNRNYVVRIYKTIAQTLLSSAFWGKKQVLFGGFNVLALLGRRVGVFVR